MAADELGPLPAGRHGFTREQVAHNQRERLLAGFATAVAKDGYAAVTITSITKAASVSRRVFYENFAAKEECFIATFDAVAEHIRDLVDDAVAAEPDWPSRVVAAARSALAFLAAEPDLARLCLVEAQSAEPVVSAHFHAAVRELAIPLRAGRGERAGDRELPPNTEDSLAGALVSLAGRKVAAGEAARLEDLLPDFTEFVLAPYLGPDEAARLAAAA